MKFLIVIASICAVGYLANHWKEFGSHPLSEAANPPRLIIYSAKSNDACIKLEAELNEAGIPHQTRDLGKEENYHELSEALARIGKMGGNVAIPVAEVDGVIIENAKFPEIRRRLR